MKRLCAYKLSIIVLMIVVQSLPLIAYTLRKHTNYKPPRHIGMLVPISFEAGRGACQRIPFSEAHPINGYIDLKRSNAGDKALLHIAGSTHDQSAKQIPIALDAQILQLSDFLYFITHVASSIRRTYTYLPQGNMPVITFKNINGSGILTHACAHDRHYSLGRMDLELNAEFFGQTGLITMIIDPDPNALLIRGSGDLTPIKTSCMQILDIHLSYLYDLINPRNDHCGMEGRLIIPALHIDQRLRFDFKCDRFLARFDTQCSACTLTWAIDFDPASPVDALFVYAAGTDFGKYLTDLIAEKMGRHDVTITVMNARGSSTCRELQIKKAPTFDLLTLEVEVHQRARTQLTFKKVLFDCGKPAVSLKHVISHIIRTVNEL